MPLLRKEIVGSEERTKWINQKYHLVLDNIDVFARGGFAVLEKSDAMKQHEKWVEETIKRKPKHTREGLPIQPWHGLAALMILFASMVLIGYILHG